MKYRVGNYPPPAKESRQNVFKKKTVIKTLFYFIVIPVWWVWCTYFKWIAVIERGKSLVEEGWSELRGLHVKSSDFLLTPTLSQMYEYNSNRIFTNIFLPVFVETLISTQPVILSFKKYLVEQTFLEELHLGDFLKVLLVIGFSTMVPNLMQNHLKNTIFFITFRLVPNWLQNLVFFWSGPKKMGFSHDFVTSFGPVL